MAYTDDAVLAKLSALSEAADSIVTQAQWIMFHRRHADRTVQLWLQRLKDSTSHKRLNLIYLANEVAQQTKARHKEDFVVAFSPVIAEAVATAYKGASADIQNRIQRVVDVWKDREIFEKPIIEAIDTRIQEINQARGTVKAGLGGSIFGSAATIPAELAPLTTPQQNVTKLLLGMRTTANSANQEYDKLLGPNSTAPSAPVYAARLSGLLKTLAQAEGAVEQCVKARRELVLALQKVLDTNRNALVFEENQLETFVTRRMEVEDKKTEVERAIMAGLPDDEPFLSGNGLSDQPDPELERPEVEALTPPSMDSDHPEQSDSKDETESRATAIQPDKKITGTHSILGLQFKSVSTTTNGSKKRKIDDADGFPDLGEDDDIDSDVAEMLRRDSGGS
ncbi:DUF618-domain-containing protein [Annulohypoxylon maeteangense]|uniref:DUF618-domain-containing protein n=1 Tax=Annulohypoxylon maeteangense TaxID=1927788 RepID=UPI0020080360|nr:DUF618-domain-containing protein [Annulohypoxylon maeteangense]KAI0881159.1 DUF618-domain-containing protein [Annulohypoxylon maeteangense]